ncbi:MAG: hypothetical protein ACYC3I_21595 [Gemmataceae bacterium]
MTEALWVAFIGAAATICAAVIARYARARPCPPRDTKSLEKLREWIRSEPSIPWYWPTGLCNVEVRILVEELSLGLRCDDKSLGLFRVTGVDANLQEVLHLEGSNSHVAVLEVGLNRGDLSDELMRSLFHAARCKREHKRTEDIVYLSDYEKHLRSVSEILKKNGTS